MSYKIVAFIVPSKSVGRTSSYALAVTLFLVQVLVEILKRDFLPFSYSTMNGVNIHIDTLVYSFHTVGNKDLSLYLLCLINTCKLFQLFSKAPPISFLLRNVTKKLR